MSEIIIYEGTMCCSLGLCGPNPDSNLVAFSQSLEKIQEEFKDIKIKRSSLSFGLNVFLSNKEIFEKLKEKGPEILPIITIDGNIISEKTYLSYNDLKNALSNKNSKTTR